MDNIDLENLGNHVQDLIDRAVNSQNYQKLNQSITQAVNRTISQYQANMPARQAKNQVKEAPPAYAQLAGPRTKSILQLVFGGVLTGSMAVAFLSVGIWNLFGGSASPAGLGAVTAGLLAGIALLWLGCSGIGRLGRFKKYTRALGTRTYCDFQTLAKAVNKPVKFVIRDVKAMIGKGWFLEGHVDRQETCLITTDETFRHYETAQKQLEQKEQERKSREKAEAERRKASPEVQEVLDRGNEFLEKIHKSNDAIPGEEISAKISRMEQIVEQIFRRAQEHPEVIPDLKRMMNYYLPMTVKLLDAYEEMDAQPVQGENIQSSKREIENTLDTLNSAFEKLLDSIFRDTALDLSSDITALHTILAQEGLAGEDFEKKKS